MSDIPKCIRCRNNSAVVHKFARQYFCKICNISFDDDADDVGTYSNNPMMRLQREERRAARRRQNLLDNL